MIHTNGSKRNFQFARSGTVVLFFFLSTRVVRGRTCSVHAHLTVTTCVPCVIHQLILTCMPSALWSRTANDSASTALCVINAPMCVRAAPTNDHPENTSKVWDGPQQLHVLLQMCTKARTCHLGHTVRPHRLCMAVRFAVSNHQWCLRAQRRGV